MNTSPFMTEYPESIVTGIAPTDKMKALANGLVAWGHCYMGINPPENFGKALVAIADRLGMTEAATGDNLVKLSQKIRSGEVVL